MAKKNRSFVLSLLVLFTSIGWPLRTLAHGVLIDAKPIPSFQIQVRYESGEPMANAQINVYAPTNPQNVWLQTLTDENGYFLFTPDPNVSGIWDIQARLAGHGELLQLEVKEDGAIHQIDPSRGNPVQKWLMIAAVVWGFVGTALFFSNRQPPTNRVLSPPEHHLP